MKWSCGRTVVVQGERHQRSLAIRREDTGHVRKLCVKHCLSLKTFIFNFVAFFVSLGTAISCIRKLTCTNFPYIFYKFTHFRFSCSPYIFLNLQHLQLRFTHFTYSNLTAMVLGHFGKTGVYAGRPLFHYPSPRRSAKREFTLAGHCFIIHLPGGGH